jgi:cytochrome c-type biogenesis protein CcmF
MISILGRSVVLLGLLVAVLGAIIAFVSAARENRTGMRLARRLAYVFSGTMIFATALMEYALLTHDFSVDYVAQVGSLSTPTIITIVSLWSALEGSILLWALFLGVFTLIFARQSRKLDPQQSAYSLGVLLSICVFFAFLVASIANPFAPVEQVVLDGPGPNPLLQNHPLMIIHPPSLYAGFVGMSVPFSIGAGALLAGRMDGLWVSLLRRWALVIWSFLTLGILLGGWWSYEVLGWGGYWAWDPVENGSFMPWLTLTAFLHSAMVTEKRKMFSAWSIVLILVSFLLTLLGTFLTRSGVLESVHNFSEGSIGPTFFAFIGFTLVFCVALLAARLDRMPTGQKPLHPVSREFAFLINNLLLVVFTFTVLLGTLFPLIVEAVTVNNERISVGRPFFDVVCGPICLMLVFMMGVGPSLPWGRASNEDFHKLRMPLMVAFVSAGVSAGVSWALGMQSIYGLLTFFIVGAAASVSVREILSPALLRRKSRGEPFLLAFWKSLGGSRRRIGGHIAHLGLFLLAISIATAETHRRDTRAALTQDVAQNVFGYDLKFKEQKLEKQPHRESNVALIEVSVGGRSLGELSPRDNTYMKGKMAGQKIGTPSVRSGFKEDLYVTLLRVDESAGVQIASVRIIVQPMMRWLWMGGLIMVAGGLVAAWPKRARA